MGGEDLVCVKSEVRGGEGARRFMLREGEGRVCLGEIRVASINFAAQTYQNVLF